MSRFHQVLLACATLALSWLLMQVVHELGHVAAAWMTGGTVTNVVLHPLTISRTDVEPNPRPLIVAWGGPAIGASVPAAVWLVVASARLPFAFVWRFFAGFCLIANGLYLGVGSFDRVGDAGDILRFGSPIGTLWLFGLAAVPLGLWLWNGLEFMFGFRAQQKRISPRLAFGAALALAIVITLELLLSGR